MSSQAKKQQEAKYYQQLAEAAAQYVDDPLGFVLFTFPWGEGQLAKYDGPDTWQVEVLEQIRDGVLSVDSAIQVAVASGHGIGKVIQNCEEIHTLSGSKRWGDIQVGDQIFGSNGSPTTVIARYDHKDWPFYKVTFDDGSFVHVGPEHLWAVRGRQERRKKVDGWRVLSTEQIMEIGVKRPNGTAMARQWEIPIQGPAQFEEREIDIHPYLMGVWLGDGQKGTPFYHKSHQEVKERIESFGYEVTTGRDGKRQRVRGISHLLTNPVFQCGSHERYIPDDYKYNTVANREELLRGLLDTDGEIGKQGSIGYATTSKRLAEDVIWLVRSLGGKAMMQPTPKQGWYPGEDGEQVICRKCYRVTINLPWNPFTIKHRKERYKPSEPRYLKRWIDSIEFSHYGDGHCITVDAPDHLYQAQDFIVTHNTALVSWIILWFIATRPHPQVVVTANTKGQLTSKTWRELSKWHKLSNVGDMMEWTATKFYMKQHPETWFAAAIAWSATNSEAFAGTHAEHVLIIFDEASAIDDIIWEVTEGAMTTSGAMWIAFGNPTKNSGRFRECFRDQKHRWKTMQVDSRTAKMTDKTKLNQWVDDYGEDSDFVRVRVRGVFPRAATSQFISNELADEAMKRTLDEEAYKSFPVVIGVDVAREGDDQSVISIRQGMKLWPQRKYRIPDLMEIVDKAIMAYEEFNAQMIFVDAIGLGAGVYDRLKQLRYPVMPVMVGQKPTGFSKNPHSANQQTQYFNLRAELWDRMKDWLQTADIPDDPELKKALTGIEYGFDGKDRLQLERKKDMKARGLDSPDEGDSIALTFYKTVETRQQQERKRRKINPRRRRDWRLI